MRECCEVLFTNKFLQKNMSQDKSKDSMEGTPGVADPKLYIQALVGELQRTLRMEIGQIHDRLDRMESSIQTPQQ